MKSPPSTERGRASLQRIVHAACELFYRQGVNATGLADVTERSDTGKGQIYHYFADKDDLILTVIEAQVELGLTLVRDDLDAIHTAQDLHRWADKLVAAQTHEGPARCPLGALVIELADNHSEFRAALDEGFRRWRDAIAVTLARLQETQEIAAGDDPTDLAEIILCAYEGGILLSEAHGDTRSLDLALDFAIRQITSPDRPHLSARGR